MKKTIKKKASFNNIIKKTIFGIIIILGLYILVSIISSRFVDQQVEELINSTSNYYVRILNKNLCDINNCLKNIIIFNSDTDLLKNTKDPLQAIPASQRISEKLDFYRSSFGNEYHYVVCFENQDRYCYSDSESMNINKRNKIHSEVIKIMKNSDREHQQVSWTKWNINIILNEAYVMNYVYFDGVFACSYILIDDLVKTVDVIDHGESNYCIIKSLDGYVFNQKYRETDINKFETDRIFNKIFKKYIKIEKTIDCANFIIDIVFINNEDFIYAKWIQHLIMLTLLVAVIIQTFSLWNIEMNIIIPMQKFSNNIAKLEKNNNKYYLNSFNIIELDKANKLFEKFLNQVTELKIQLYEQINEQQKMEIEFMKLQIKPHFYINCLSIIYSMACIGDLESIQKMSIYISDYFRYIFKSNSDLVFLADELVHIDNYLKICSIRYNKKIDYEIAKSENIDWILIPPLLIHTFVENSLKYGFDKGDKTKIIISIKIIKDVYRSYIDITIEDSGKGFSKDILKCLQRGDDIVTEAGTRIGINNIIKRLRYEYKEDSVIRFCNKESGGALVNINIPIKHR